MSGDELAMRIIGEAIPSLGVEFELFPPIHRLLLPASFPQLAAAPPARLAAPCPCPLSLTPFLELCVHG